MSEVLSQTEIDQLLRAINAGDDDPDDLRPACDSRRIKIYDFKRPDKFTKEQIRIVSFIHEILSRELTNHYSSLLKNVVHIHVASVDQLTYEEFIRSIPSPTTLGIIGMSPLGNAVVEFDPAVTFAMISGLMGGNPESVTCQHELTNIEKIIIGKPIYILLEAIKKSWSDFFNLETSLCQIETNPQFVYIVPPTEMCVMITLEARINEVEGIINYCIPISVLEEHLHKLTYKTLYKYNKPKKIQDYVNVTECECFLKAISHTKEITIGELNEVSIGDIIRFDEETNVLVVESTRNLFKFEYIKEAKVKRCIILKKKINKVEKNYMDEKHISEKISVNLSDVNVQLSVELGRRKMQIKEILELGEGSILELDKLAGEPVDVFANNVLIAKGEVVVIDENFGVRITDITGRNRL